MRGLARFWYEEHRVTASLGPLRTRNLADEAINAAVVQPFSASTIHIGASAMPKKLREKLTVRPASRNASA